MSEKVRLVAGRELDRAVDDALGRGLPPSREYAMAQVVWPMVSMTGQTFVLRDGRSVPMPPGETLPLPKGSHSFNDRYALHIAKFLGDEIREAVDAYRMPSPDYSTDEGAAVRATESFVCVDWNKRTKTSHFVRVIASESEFADCIAPTFCLAICGAILKLKGVEFDV